jgi:hypothetical protein
MTTRKANNFAGCYRETESFVKNVHVPKLETGKRTVVSFPYFCCVIVNM